jgi:hypothetical protein
MSIVFAFIGAAAAVATAVAAFVFYARAQAVGNDAHARKLAAAAVSSRVTAQRRPTRATPEEGPNGITLPTRRGIVGAFYQVRPVRPPRLEQLDAILARHGRTILLTPADRQAGVDPAPERVRGLVVDHGDLFSGSRAAPPDFFRLTTGRLELYDDRAVFYPEDGSATVRSAFGRPPARRALAAGEVAAVVEKARSLGRGVLNDAQASSLATALSSPDQKLVATPAAGQAASAVPDPQAVTPAAGGAVTVRFSDGELHLGPLGELLPGPAGPPPPPRPSAAAFLTVMAASLGGFGLSVVLFVGAVLLLRGLPSGRRLHFTWAWLEILVVATAATAFAWMAASFRDAVVAYEGPSLTNGPGGAAGSLSPPAVAAAAGLLALVYPIAVLLLLRRPAVRDYFHPTE